MHWLKIICTFCVSLLAIVLVVYGREWLSSGKMRVCHHPYALCTSARCIPEPGNPDRAFCFCDVEEGWSMSTVPCSQLRPTIDREGIMTLWSTFSYRQYGEGKRTMRCPGGTPWTWCLNKKCTVDPADPRRAVCLCDVMRTKDDWITFGGDCHPSTCTTAYWSGAGLKDFEEGNVFLKKQLHLDHSPVKWCPAESH